MCDLAKTYTAIDAANAADPNLFGGQPRAQVQGRRATEWLSKLAESPTAELQLAARAHHLRRWEIARSDYPEGRSGYLKWRRANKQHQAASLAELMQADAWPPAAIDRARELLIRRRLGDDIETQTLEDAACLVFLESQFDAMVERLDHDHLVSVVAKTLDKMSDRAIALAATIPVSDRPKRVLTEALGLVGSP